MAGRVYAVIHRDWLSNFGFSLVQLFAKVFLCWGETADLVDSTAQVHGCVGSRREEKGVVLSI